jgi:hypothetical protein
MACDYKGSLRSASAHANAAREEVTITVDALRIVAALAAVFNERAAGANTRIRVRFIFSAAPGLEAPYIVLFSDHAAGGAFAAPKGANTLQTRGRKHALVEAIRT